MTDNERIAKRFEFDLTMGLFKPINSRLNAFKSVDTNDDTYIFIIHEKSDYIRFSKVLESIGFKVRHMSFNFPLTKGITISLKDKNFWTFQRSYRTNPFVSENKLPDYIKEYKL